MQISALSDRGLVRKENEDHFLSAVNNNGDTLAVICDGIGGSLGGGLASAISVEMLLSAFEKAPSLEKDWQVDEWIRLNLNQINMAILSRSLSGKEHAGMGTTAAGTLVTSAGTYVFNVGDSRVYALYEDGLIQMTRDHSLIQTLIDQNRVSQEEARFHEKRSMLTNALGVWKIFRIEVDKITSDWKSLLVCSDGLHGYVADRLIEEVLLQPISTEEKASWLVALANQAGGHDNVSVIIIERGN